MKELTANESFKEIYGKTTDYTRLREIVSELYAIKEQLVKDKYCSLNLFLSIDAISAHVQDIEEYYENQSKKTK